MTRQLATADGSMTLYIPELDETFHSTKGAVTESRHVYIDSGLRHRAAMSDRSVNVLEVGFGTGLNCALSVMAVSNPVTYISLELHPLPPSTGATLYGDCPYIAEIGDAPWEVPVEIAPCFILIKRCADLLSASLPADIDVVYFDAFSPDKQPELWTEDLFRRLYDAMAPGGVLVTYCAKGEVRRRMTRAGFKVERIPGPPGGKREMLRANKTASGGVI